MLPNGLLRRASLKVREWPLPDVDRGPAHPSEELQALRLGEDEEGVVDVEPPCRRVGGAGAAPSAGREGEVEDLEKLGTGSESTMVSIGCCYIAIFVERFRFSILGESVTSLQK